MKIKISESSTWDDKKSKRRFCLFPLKAIKPGDPLKTFLVWWEWVEWNEVYSEWIII